MQFEFLFLQHLFGMQILIEKNKIKIKNCMQYLHDDDGLLAFTMKMQSGRKIDFLFFQLQF